jgi:hypothetical protein
MFTITVVITVQQTSAHISMSGNTVDAVNLRMQTGCINNLVHNIRHLHAGKTTVFSK